MYRDLAMFENIEMVTDCLHATETKYRDTMIMSWTLYKEIITYTGDKFSDDFIRLVYKTLDEWGMNARAAELNKFEDFSQSIIENKYAIEFLYKYNIKQLGKNIYVKERLETLFSLLRLAAANKPPLVTFAKTMHFFLPELIVPIDRKFIVKYFTNNTTIPDGIEEQFQFFLDVEKEFSKFSNKVDLSQFVSINNRWNIKETKIMDNMIIGYTLLQDNANSRN
ncbi:MAG: hypothetical protein LBK66_04415 [Spirochaetaceae bacterium]|jgi:hypothetical protein|nr:hypothetical protein [Spirochaetaceae bacterium]